MLTRLHHTNCVQCGKPYGSPEFVYHAGRIEKGPAYWSDRGLLCSQVCAAEHHASRAEAGNPMHEPAENPLERIGARRG